MKLKVLFFLFSILLILYRIYLGIFYDIDLFGAERGIVDGVVVLWPDEITYLTWLDARAGVFSDVISGEREATNLFGYYISGLYYVSGKWWFPYISGIFGLLFFLKSSESLVRRIGLGGNQELLLILMYLSPTVLMLSASMLRDLYILSVVNLILIYSIERKILFILFFGIVLFFLRNFYVPLLMPFVIYFMFRGGGIQSPIIILSSVGSLVGVFLLVYVKPSIYETSFQDVAMRVVSAFTGINVELMRPLESVGRGVIYSLEYFGLLFQLLISIIFWGYIFLQRGRFNILILPLFSFILGMAIIYGYFLGYFVSRTKLSIVWLMIVYIILDRSAVRNKLDGV